MFKNFTSRMIKIQAADGFTVEIPPSGIVVKLSERKNLLGNPIMVPSSFDLDGKPVQFPADDHDVWLVEDKATADKMAANGDHVIGMGF